MPSHRASTPLHDIAYQIGLASNFVAGFDVKTFAADLRTVYAVTNCLEIICEATRRVPDDVKS
jgi:uncharacterized protein with HEPN domain